MAWPAGCRRPHRRYELQGSHLPGCLHQQACTLICYRRLLTARLDACAASRLAAEMTSNGAAESP
ncbi:hypothetical protein [Streptomyces sp. NBC_01006]|uniref:hypothetical protein n=1 Tax=Streptomyces sp. NBC_01006 TaxID=2903716 RepID=UPI00386C8290|nr:hypothetical protein OG509_00875 [Streptomyces sp. NBC_01006]